MSPLRSYRKRILLITVVTLSLFTACSNSNSKSVFNPDTGHLENWASPSVHGIDAKAKPGSSGFTSCQVCHGNDFSGGISGKACSVCHGVPAPHPARPWFGGTSNHTTTHPGNAPVCAQCHTNGSNSSLKPLTPVPPGTAPNCFNNTLCHGPRGEHPSGWSNPDQHGVSAKAQPDGASGFSYCQICHGNNFAGGNVQVTCFSNNACHQVAAPHPPKPWRGGTRTHTNTHPENAVVCATCHINGANSSFSPSVPAPPGTIPGCFNSTLCHGARPAHPDGWENPDQHGVTAKAAPGSTSGFSNCQICHGNDFGGGNVQITCLSNSACHRVAAPHSPKPWRGGTRTHTTTDTGNAPACARCHTNGANSSLTPSTPAPPGTQPGCFNSTLCHGPRPAHSTGWFNPDQHGVSAKSIPGTSSGFSYCQVCHGTLFNGGSVQVTCLSSTACHRAPAPHSPAPWRGGTRTHTSTDQQNAHACGLCHASSSLIPGAIFGCFNSTLCHGQAAHPAGWTTGHSLTARQSNTSCGTASCHGVDFSGGAVGISCFICHLGGPAPGPGIQHPNRWSDPFRDHRSYIENLGGNASSCNPPPSPKGVNIAQYCHGQNLLNASPRIAPPNGSWIAGPSCFTCHGKEWNAP